MNFGRQKILSCYPSLFQKSKADRITDKTYEKPVSTTTRSLFGRRIGRLFNFITYDLEIDGKYDIALPAEEIGEVITEVWNTREKA